MKRYLTVGPTQIHPIVKQEFVNAINNGIFLCHTGAPDLGKFMIQLAIACGICCQYLQIGGSSF